MGSGGVGGAGAGGGGGDGEALQSGEVKEGTQEQPMGPDSFPSRPPRSNSHRSLGYIAFLK